MEAPHSATTFLASVLNLSPVGWTTVMVIAPVLLVLSRVRIQDGKESPSAMRLGELGNIYASPVSDGRNVFITDLQGTTMVITADEQPKLVSINRLDEAVSASLAIGDGELFVRGEKHLYCIRK